MDCKSIMSIGMQWKLIKLLSKRWWMGNLWHTLESFCFNHSSTTNSSNKVSDRCLAATYGGYDTIVVEDGTFQSQIVAIDLNSGDEFYVYVNEAKDPRASYVCTPAGSCVDAIMTPIYGGPGGLIKNVDLHQGRVYQISGWGIVDDSIHPGIANFHWKSDKQTTFNDDYGWAADDIVDSCSTYTLT
eukprot:1068890_1